MVDLPLTLFVDAFFCSPWDFRCQVALAEKGLDYAVSRVMVGEGQGLSQAYKDRTVTGRVPALAHGDFWLAESQAIIEYLEETFPPDAWPRLLPAEPRARARARQVLAFLTGELRTLIRERPSWMIVYPAAPPPLSPRARFAADELLAIAARLCADGLFANWSIACADLTFALLRLARTGEALAPELQALIDGCLARPSVRAYLEHERPPNPPVTGRRAMT